MSPGWQKALNLNLTEDTGFLTTSFLKSRRLPLQIYMEVGRFDRLLLEPNRHLRDILRLKGYPVTYSEFDGGHDYVCWRGTIAEGTRCAPWPATCQADKIAVETARRTHALLLALAKSLWEQLNLSVPPAAVWAPGLAVVRPILAGQTHQPAFAVTLAKRREVSTDTSFSRASCVRAIPSCRNGLRSWKPSRARRRSSSGRLASDGSMFSCVRLCGAAKPASRRRPAGPTVRRNGAWSEGALLPVWQEGVCTTPVCPLLRRQQVRMSCTVDPAPPCNLTIVIDGKGRVQIQPCPVRGS